MNKLNKKHKRAFSSPVRNFLIGMGSVLNLAGNYYSNRYSRLVEEMDEGTLENDLGRIGIDLDYVKKKYSKFILH